MAQHFKKNLSNSNKIFKISSNGNKIFKNLVKWQQDYQKLTTVPSYVIIFNFSFLFSIESNKDSAVPNVKLLPRDKADNDKSNFKKISDAIKDSKKGKTLGIFEKDKGFPGPFMDNWRNVQSEFSTEDMTSSIAYVTASKVVISILNKFENFFKNN